MEDTCVAYAGPPDSLLSEESLDSDGPLELDEPKSSLTSEAEDSLLLLSLLAEEEEGDGGKGMGGAFPWRNDEAIYPV